MKLLLFIGHRDVDGSGFSDYPPCGAGGPASSSSLHEANLEIALGTPSGSLLSIFEVHSRPFSNLVSGRIWLYSAVLTA